MTRKIISNFFKNISIRVDEFLSFDNSSNDKKIFVLTFHSVHLDKDKHRLSNYLNPSSSISISKLEKFIDYFLKKNIRFINSKNLINNNISDINIILSFDD